MRNTQQALCLVVGSGILAVTLSSATEAEATTITYRVAQESSAGAGDFDANVLGFVDPFNTALTAAAFYQYHNPNLSSYNGELNGGPNGVDGLSQVFLVSASDGLSESYRESARAS